MYAIALLIMETFATSLDSLEAKLSSLQDLKEDLVRLFGEGNIFGNEPEKSPDVLNSSDDSKPEPTASCVEESEVSRLRVEVKELFHMIKGIGKLEEEVADLTGLIKEKEKEWRSQKREMENKMQVLEEKLKKNEPRMEETNILQINETRLDRLEKEVERMKENELELRRLKRKNLVISNMPDSTDGVEKMVQRLFQEVLKVKVKPIEAKVIARCRDGGNMVLVCMKDLREKLEVMRWKHKLSTLDRKMFVMDDLTREERSVQKEIRERVKEEKRKGNQWKVGYRKVCMEGQWVPWEAVA